MSTEDPKSKTDAPAPQAAASTNEIVNNDENGVILETAQIILMKEYSQTVATLKSTFEKDPGNKIYDISQGWIAPSARKLSPCIIIASANDNSDVVKILTVLKSLKTETQNKKVKFIVISKIKNGGIIEKFKQFGCQDFIMEPIADKTLEFKVKLHVNALKSLRKKRRMDILRQQESEEAAIKKKEAEAAKKKSNDAKVAARAEEVKRFSMSKKDGKKDQDKWVFKSSKKKNGDPDSKDNESTDASMPDPTQGDWVETVNKDGKKSWKFVPKGADPNSAGEGQESWEYEGETKPEFKDGGWSFEGKDVKLKHVDKDGNDEILELEVEEYKGEAEDEESEEEEIESSAFDLKKIQNKDEESIDFKAKDYKPEESEEETGQEEEIESSSFSAKKMKTGSTYEEETGATEETGDYIAKKDAAKNKAYPDDYVVEQEEGTMLEYEDKPESKIDFKKKKKKKKDGLGEDGETADFTDVAENARDVADFIDKKKKSPFGKDYVNEAEAVAGIEVCDKTGDDENGIETDDFNESSDAALEIGSPLVMMVEIVDLVYDTGPLGVEGQDLIEQMKSLNVRMADYLRNSLNATEFAVHRVTGGKVDAEPVLGKKYKIHEEEQLFKKVLASKTVVKGEVNSEREVVTLAYPVEGAVVFVETKIRNELVDKASQFQSVIASVITVIAA